MPKRPLIIDCHVHLSAENVEGCYVSPRYKKGFAFRYLKRALRLKGMEGEGLNKAYLNLIIQRLEGARGLLDAVVLLPLDGRCNDEGLLDLDNTSFYISNDYCFEACSRDPRLLPAASINPKRRDALERLEEVVERGAVVLKTIPNSQDFDPADPAFLPFWRKMADLGLPWLTHTGREYTIPSTYQRYGDPERLIPALEEGVTVIAAHAGSAGGIPAPETCGRFLEMLPRYSNLYGDISALTSLGRSRYLPRLLKHGECMERLMYGSDYPIPSDPKLLSSSLGWKWARALRRKGNWLSRPLIVSRAMGVPEHVFERADSVLRITDAQREAIASLRAETSSQR